MKRTYRTIVTLLIAATSMAAAPCALAAVGVDLVWAPTYSMAQATPAVTSAVGLAGGGLQFNFVLGRKVDLQLAGLYLTREFNDGALRTSSMISGNLGFKLKVSRAFFLNAGGYYNSYLSGAIATGSQDYGAFGGLGVVLPLGRSVGLLINPQYRYALKTLSYGSMTPHEVVALIGLSFGGSKGR